MKILVMGCGSIGKRHIENLLYLRVGKILVFDVDEKKLNEISKISSTIKTSTSLNSMWREKPDAVFVAVPTGLHIKYAIAAAKRRCHLFIEKPLSNDMEGVNELVRITESNKLTVFVGYNYRFNDCLIQLKRLIEHNAIGNIISGRVQFGSYLPERHPWEDYRLGYGAKKSLGGGVILDVLSHHLDAFIFLLGKPKEVFCYADKRSKLEIDVEDMSEALMKFPGGEVVSFHADFIQRPHSHTLELIGEKGMILCDFPGNTLKYYDVRKSKWVIIPKLQNHNITYIEELKHFFVCIKKKTLPPVDIFLAKEELNILMKIKKSAFMRRWIKV